MSEFWNERNLNAPALKSCIIKGDMQLKQGNNPQLNNFF